MKRIIITLILLSFIIQIVHATELSSASIKESVESIINEFTQGDKLFYIYDEADAGAFLAVYFGLFSDNLEKYNLYSEEKNFIKSANEQIPKNELNNRNVVVFGGPCANRYWNEFSDETCENWPYEPGQSIVKVVNNNGYLTLLIAGTDKKDTFEIARLILQYNINENLDQKGFYLHKSTSKRVTNVDKCKQETRDYTCFSFPYNAEFVYNKNNHEYAITLRNINEMDNVITFTLNGNPYSLELGDFITENNVEVTPSSIRHNPITAEANSVIFHFSEPMEGFKQWGMKPFSEDGQKCYGLKPRERILVYFPNENVPYDVTFKNSNNDKVDILLDGKLYSGVSEGAEIDNIRGRPIRIGNFFEPLGTDSVHTTEICFEDIKSECTIYTERLVPINLEPRYNVEINSKEKCKSVYNANKLDLENNICTRLLSEPIKKVFLRWDFKAIEKYDLDCTD